MGCCGEGAKDVPLKEIKPYSRRSCSDVLFLLAFLAFWGATGFFLFQAKKDGANYWRVIRGADMQGRVCGVDQGVEDKPFTGWPYPPDYAYMVCLKSCEDTKTDPDNNIAYRTKSLQIGYYCLPFLDESISVNIKFSGDWDTDFGTRNLADIWIARYDILASIGVALVLAFVYIALIEYCAGCLVWGCVLFTAAGGGFLSWYFLSESTGDINYPDDLNMRKALKTTGIILAVFTGLFVVVVFFMRKTISLAIKVVQESAKVLEDVKSLLVWPLVPLFFGVIYFAFWAAAALYVYSVGTDTLAGPPPYAISHKFNSSFFPTDQPNANINITHVHFHEFDKKYEVVMWVHLFGFFWNAQFLLYLGSMVVSGAVADWYFSSHQSRESWSRMPVCSSFLRTLRFHVGSVALGSLILAVIRFTRAVLMYMQKKFLSDDPNGLQKCMVCIVNCFLKCLDCCLDKISKNGFVWISIWGGSFCTGSCSAFELVWRNLGRVAAINMVGDYLIFLGKFTVAGLSTGLFAFVLMQQDKVGSPILPCICIFLFSWCTASIFMSVFDSIVDATFICFLVDCEHNRDGHMMASKGLRDLVDKHSEASQAEANRRYRRKQAYKGIQPGDQYRRIDS